MGDVVWQAVVGDEAAWQVRDSRVAIRAARADDAEALYECKRTREAQQFVSRIVRSPSESRALIEEQRADEHGIRCVIEVDGSVVGDIGGRFDRPGSLTTVPEEWDFQLGYAVHPAMWGKGVASGAVGLFTSLLHQTFGVRRIVAKVFEDNRASIRVLRKHGFRLEGTEIAAVLGRDGTWLNDCTLAHLAPVGRR